MNYTQALEYIHGISWTFCKSGLDRIRELCEKLGNPQDKLKFIHVAGTNGKGSFCSMLQSILTEEGYKTGLYTSPYIKVFNERMQIDGNAISDEKLAEITSRVKPIADSMKDKPTEFELITAIAFLYFYEAKCDIVVLEAGMGGRLDSTNIIKTPLLSVITGIALDHVDYLGDTVEKIAYEKAGIIKPSIPVLFGGDCKEAENVIEQRAKEISSEFFCVDYSLLHVKHSDLEGTVFDYGNRNDIEINLLGLYQPKNASVVLNAVDILKGQGLSISESAIIRGLKKAAWPARFEIIHREPLIIFDGAHNAQGITSAVQSIRHYFGEEKVYALTGVLRDKDYKIIASELAKVTQRAFTLTPMSPRALSGEEYAKVLSSQGIKAFPNDDIESAFDLACESARIDKKPLVVLGSLYTYVDIIKLIEKL